MLPVLCVLGCHLFSVWCGHSHDLVMLKPVLSASPGLVYIQETSCVDRRVNAMFAARAAAHAGAHAVFCSYTGIVL